MLVRKNIFISACLIALFLCQGCEKEDSEIEDELILTRLLTLTVDPRHYPAFPYDKRWVVIHDRDGKLLALERFKLGDQLKFTTLQPVPGNSINITIVMCNSGQCKVCSTLDYPTGQEMTLHTWRTPFSDANPLPFPIGSFYINMTTDNSFDQLSISNKLGLETIVFAGENHKFDVRTALHAGTKYMVEASDVLGNLRYKILENIKPNDSFDLSFSSMPTFNKTVEFSFPQACNINLNVWGHEADQNFVDLGYVLNNHFQDDLRKSIKAGYLTTLDKYYTQLTATFPKYKYTYVNRGSVPNSISAWPLPSDYSLVSKSIGAFGSKTHNKFSWRTSSWVDNQVGTNFTWDVTSPYATHKLTELPEEILKLHPALALSKMKYVSTAYYTSDIPYPRLLDINLQEDPHIIKGITINE